MFINFKELIRTLEDIELDNIPDYVRICFDKTGFYFEGNSPEETKELNVRWKWLITILNKRAGVQEMLSISDIAKHLGMSPNTVRSILKEQDKNNIVLPFINTSRGIKIKTSDYFKFLENNYTTTYEDDLENK